MERVGYENLSWNELSERLRILERDRGDTSAVDPLLHELQVHQVELEMQNRELRESQAHLQASRGRYAELFDQAPVGYVTLDVNGVVTEANACAATLLGQPLALLLGMPFSAAASVRDVSAFHAHLRACRRSGRRMTVDVETTKTDGGALVIQLVTAAVVSGNGEVLCYRVTLSDLSEQRRAQEEKARLEQEKRARVEADAATRMRDHFLSIVSHELRDPLNIIMAWAQMLEGRPADPEFVTRGVRVMRRNGQVLTRVVDDILDLSRLMNGKWPVATGKVAFSDVVRATIEAVRGHALAKGIEIVESISRDCALRGDGARLEQMVSNLLSNAVKFGKSGGHVWVELEREPHAVRLTVRDDGSGIEAADLPYVFDSFRQDDGTMSRAQPGLGLGLAIAKQIALSHGGAIEATSDGRDRGTTVIVELPPGIVSTPPPPAPASERRVDEAALEGVKVLFVDDDAEACELAMLIFSECGADVLTAESVDSALASLASFEPDIVVSDVSMPVRDGYDLVRRLRSMPGRIASIPMIALTGYACPEDAERALRAGFSKHLSKPVGVDEIAAFVADTLHGR